MVVYNYKPNVFQSLESNNIDFNTQYLLKTLKNTTFKNSEGVY